MKGPQPHRLARVEHEYERFGAWAYLGNAELRSMDLWAERNPSTHPLAFYFLPFYFRAEGSTQWCKVLESTAPPPNILDT